MQNTSIEWSDHTWNPWTGCKKVTIGCKFCYMHRDKYRWSGDAQAGSQLKRASKQMFDLPLKLQKQGIKDALVFTCSMSDFFEPRADKFRAEAWEIIRKTPELTYQILTKRPERIKACLPKDWGKGYENVWLGTSIEIKELGERAHLLLDVPAKVRFLSIEPLLGPISLPVISIDWVILGGESGNEIGPFQYRPSELKWFESLISDCDYFDIPVFVKQLGTHLSKQLGLKDRHGRDINEFPELLQTRQMPKGYLKTG